MSREKITKFREMVSSLSEEDLDDLDGEIRARKTREEFGAENFSDGAIAFGRKPVCPGCSSSSCVKYGKTGYGEQRYACRECGKTFTLMSRSVFSGAKMTMKDIATMLTLMSYNVPLDVVAEVAGTHHNTALLWRRKAFATVDGWQEKVVLRDRIWIDEVYTFDSDMPKDHFGPNVRGTSHRKCCIFLAIDRHKSMIAFFIGHSKPKPKALLKALDGHVAKGSVIVHDGLREYEGVLRQIGAEGERHPYKRNDRETLEAMLMINSFSAWIKRYLDRFTGMRTKWLQSYLNWFVYVFRVKNQSKTWAIDTRIVRHLLLSEAIFKRSS